MGNYCTLITKKAENKAAKVDKTPNFGWVFYQLKNGCNWGDLPKDLPPYSTVFWHYKHWRWEGVFDQMLTTLHSQVREYAQNNQSGQDY